MPSVRFLPAEIAVEVPAGTLIHEAAHRAGLTNLESALRRTGDLRPVPGGAGAGLAIAPLPVAGLPDQGGSPTLLVRLPEIRDTAHARGRGQPFPGQRRRPTGPRKTVAALSRSAADGAPGLHRGALQRLETAGRANWRACIPMFPSRRICACCATLAEALREQDGEITVAVAGAERRVARGRDPVPDTPTSRVCGLAIDIGTTTVAAQLVDLQRRPRARHRDFIQPADPPRRRRHQPHRLCPHPGAPGGTAAAWCSIRSTG